MTIVGGFDVHRAQITYDYLVTETGEVRTGQVAPANRLALRRWLRQFAGEDVAFAVEGCTGWRFVAQPWEDLPRQRSCSYPSPDRRRQPIQARGK